MSQGIRIYGIAAGIMAELLCIAGGLWILLNSGFDTSDPLGAGLGLYFIGKGIFVGPMLIITSLQASRMVPLDHRAQDNA